MLLPGAIGARPRVLGCTQPRLWTPPLCELTPETSVGFDQVRFAREVLRTPADPWQGWLLKHAGELLPDGRPRFRLVLVMAARQNGKTWTPVTLSLFWQFVEAVGMILGTSTKLDYARESWQKATKLARATPELEALLPPGRNRGIRNANGEQEMVTVDDSRHKIAASNEEGGRSLTLDRAILDELRQHHDYSAWDAIIPAGNAVLDFQAWAMSNAGSDKSVVLNDLRAACLRFIETGEGDPRVGLFEWSAPDGSSPLDLDALAQANPNLGRRIDPDALLGDAQRAVANGGDQLIGFMTEQMCISVSRETPPVFSPAAWEHCRDPESRRAGEPVLAVDVAPDRSAAAVSMAALQADGLPMVKVVRHGAGVAWTVKHVGEMVRSKGVRTVVIDSVGPAKNLRLDLEDELGSDAEVLVLTTGDVTDAFADLHDGVVTEQMRHLGQPELDAALAAATTRMIGDRKAWDRRKADGDITCIVSAGHALLGLRRQLGAPNLW